MVVRVPPGGAFYPSNGDQDPYWDWRRVILGHRGAVRFHRRRNGRSRDKSSSSHPKCAADGALSTAIALIR